MEILNNYLFSDKPSGTKETVLTAEIYEYLQKKVPYSRILKLVREKGYRAAYENFQTVKRAGVAYNKAGFFINLMTSEVVIEIKEGVDKSKRV